MHCARVFSLHCFRLFAGAKFHIQTHFIIREFFRLLSGSSGRWHTAYECILARCGKKKCLMFSSVFSNAGQSPYQHRCGAIIFCSVSVFSVDACVCARNSFHIFVQVLIFGHWIQYLCATASSEIKKLKWISPFVNSGAAFFCFYRTEMREIFTL